MTYRFAQLAIDNTALMASGFKQFICKVNLYSSNPAWQGNLNGGFISGILFLKTFIMIYE